ncbi:MAG: response regulator transcription factor [Myxococcales bacterium]|nr:response regulator transcription factor [Myxococcales bacterium]MCB9704526.1 response regulator transcription factor [Myxococcales bacterium]
MAATILIVDDEQDLIDSLRFNLEREGYTVLDACDGHRALDVIEERAAPPDLVLLDLMMPNLSGTEVCRRMRMSDRTRTTPVIMLSARGDEIDRVVAFELGVDDYVTKPFSVRELLLRIRAILRRQGSSDVRLTGEVVHEELRIDLDGHWVWVDDRRLELTALEFRLLAALITRRGRVQTREVLLQDVWGSEADVTTRTVDTHVQRLRRKLGDAGAYIETLRGVGYRFCDAVERREPSRPLAAAASSQACVD